jgi:hypothetical protein
VRKYADDLRKTSPQIQSLPRKRWFSKAIADSGILWYGLWYRVVAGQAMCWAQVLRCRVASCSISVWLFKRKSDSIWTELSCSEREQKPAMQNKGWFQLDQVRWMCELYPRSLSCQSCHTRLKCTNPLESDWDWLCQTRFFSIGKPCVVALYFAADSFREADADSVVLIIFELLPSKSRCCTTLVRSLYCFSVRLAITHWSFLLPPCFRCLLRHVSL